MRVLFTCWPAYGHLFPMLPLIHAARRAGHEVVIASGAEMTGAVAGIEFWQVGPSHADATRRYLSEHPGAAALPQAARIVSDLTHMFMTVASQRALDLLPRATAWRPDLVVHEPTELAGAIVAQRTGARHVVHGLSLFPDGIWTMFAGPVTTLGQQWQLPALVAAVREATYVDIVPPAMQPGGPSGFNRVQPVRPGYGLDLDTSADLGVLPRPQTVYLTMGTIFNERPEVFHTALAGLLTLPVNIVVTLGPSADPNLLGTQPEHVLVTGFIPQAALLPQVRLVVSHGGSGTVAGALAHGLPHLILPQGSDHFLNAASLQRAGAGLAVLPESFTSSAIADAAQRLLTEETFTVAAKKIQSEIEAMPSADEALAALLS